MGFSTGPLRFAFNVFVDVPNVGGVRRFCFFDPAVLFAEQSLCLGIDPRLVKFSGRQFGGDMIFNNFGEFFFQEVPNVRYIV